MNELVRKPIDPARLVRDFLDGTKPTTLAARRADLKDFAAWLGAPNPQAAAKTLLAQTHGGANALALEYRAHLASRKLSPSTINRRLSTLRSLSSLARLLGLTPWTLEVRNLRARPYRDTRGPGIEKIRLAIESLPPTPKGSRDRAILWLLSSAALRASEVCNIRLEDLDLPGLRVRITGKHRDDPEWRSIPPQANDAIKTWLQHRGVSSGPLFHRLDNARTSTTHLNRHAISRITHSLNLGKAHGIRHSAITVGLDITHDPRAVRALGRFASLETIMVYDDNREDLAGQVSKKIADKICSP
jgi:integrase/recombinase XerC